MIVVTGSMRSGTSLWMQILQRGGFPVIGEAFPTHFGDELHTANPRGFFESRLGAGIYFATNPDPDTGTFLAPAATRWHGVKVFVPGLVRSDLAYLDNVIVTVRSWRAVARSRRDFPTDTFAADADHPALSWWLETWTVIRDLMTRGYPAHVVTLDRLRQDPEREIGIAFDWIGRGDVTAAADAVDATLHRSTPDPSIAPGTDAEHVAVMDELYDHLVNERALSEAFVQKLEDTAAALAPQLRAVVHHQSRQVLERMQLLEPIA